MQYKAFCGGVNGDSVARLKNSAIILFAKTYTRKQCLLCSSRTSVLYILGGRKLSVTANN